MSAGERVARLAAVIAPTCVAVSAPSWDDDSASNCVVLKFPICASVKPATVDGFSAAI